MNALRLRKINEMRKQAQAPDVVPPPVNKGAFGKTWGGTGVMKQLQKAPAATPALKLPTKIPAAPKDSPLAAK